MAQEEDVSLILLGRPVGDQSAFELVEVKEFEAEIERETGIEAIVR